MKKFFIFLSILFYLILLYLVSLVFIVLMIFLFNLGGLNTEFNIGYILFGGLILFFGECLYLYQKI